MVQVSEESTKGSSPRSTVLPITTANLSNMNGAPETAAKDVDSGGSSSKNATSSAPPDSSKEKSTGKGTPPDKRGNSPAPQIPNSAGLEGSTPSTTNLTPQPRTGAYMVGAGGTGYTAQMTPEPPSPGGPVVLPNDAYGGVGSFFQQPSGAFVPHTSPFGAQPSPLSPPRPAAAVAMGAMGVIPPASPLFPRISSGGANNVGAALNPANSGLEGVSRGGVGAPPSPSLPYSMQPLYQTYGGSQVVPASSQSAGSPEDVGASSSWSERNSQGHLSPQVNMNAQGVPVSYAVPGSRASAGGRAYSFEDSMLPPSALDQDQGNPAYSPYNGSTGSSGGGTLFAHPQPWGYGPPDMYGNSPGSPLQPRPSTHLPMYPSQLPGGQMRPMAPYGQYFPASSPGPPIQTTASNKGPDGANLFIFHIPNHFTNLDMYQLFCPYGNLLSVRIMVEKDTGRSRGFGFVSYDSPESAALAIKELNGFAIGNKRLKVQHKQIRPKDMHGDRDPHGGGGMDGMSGGDGYPRPFNSSLPPSGPAAPHNAWYDRKNAPPNVVGGGATDGTGGLGGVDHVADIGVNKQDEHTELTSTSTGGETPLGLGTPGTENGGANPISPLASLGTLSNALPDVPGSATPE